MNVDLFYEERGSGIPLTLLHGYPLDHTIWLEVAGKLKNEARVITPDLRGQGGSPAPSGVYSMQMLAEDVLRLMDKLGVEATIIGGHSMGGYVALAMAKHHPDRLLGLTLIASHAYADSPEKRQTRLESIEQIRSRGLEPILAAMPGKLSKQPEIIEKCRNITSKASPVGVMGTLAGLAQREDYMEVFTHLKIPAMLIAGLDDQINPISINREMAAKMDKPRLVEIADAGHMPMMEQSSQVADALKSFIRSIEENS